jgi:hypothetical protein
MDHTPASDNAQLGLGHRSHPLLGKPVVDTVSGRHGILRAVAPTMTMGVRGVFEPSQSHISKFPVAAWLAPHGGGREWTTGVDAIEEDTDTPASGT